MEKKFLCLNSIDGYRIRLRADSIYEYGDLFGEDTGENDTQVAVGGKSIRGSYVNTAHSTEESTWVKETVDQIDKLLSELGSVGFAMGANNA